MYLFWQILRRKYIVVNIVKKSTEETEINKVYRQSSGSRVCRFFLREGVYEENVKGHVLALFTICVWGTTFIATKVLLKAFTPIEILFMRF